MRREGEHGVILVEDTGRGLVPEDLEGVFERFHRGADVSGAGQGSGIGLTIARGLARAMGGDLVADSPGSGRGATFSLALPRTGDPN